MTGHVYYPDISSYQPGINLADWLAVMVKATEGTGYRSGQYAAQKAEAARHGAFFGAYHFLHQGNAAAQADFCHGVVGNGIPLMVDHEPTGTSKPTVADVRAFTDRYRALGGTVHLTYTPHWYWVQLGRPSLKPLADRHLHLVTSNYSGGTPEDPSHPGWQTYGGMPPVYTVQYTSTAKVGGCDEVDLNCFRGSGRTDPQATLTELKNLWTTGTLTGIPHPPPPKPPTWTEALVNNLPTLAQGATGEDVRTLQGLLNARHQAVKVDGAFGPATSTAVIRFQSAAGFIGKDIDSIVGPRTWGKLLRR